MNWICKRTWCVLVLAWAAAWGQLCFAQAAASTAAALTDPLNRTTPRSSIYAFLDACRSRNYVKAAQYLDLSRIPKRQQDTLGPEDAHKLRSLLDHNPKFEVIHLDNTPQGRTDDDLPGDLETLASFDLDGEAIKLYLQREQRNGAQVWLVSADSVAKIPELDTLAQGPAFEKQLPGPLVHIRMLSTPLWAWIALILLAVLIAAVSKLLSAFAIAMAKPVARRYIKSVQSYRIQTFTEPVRLLLSIGVFRACMEFVATSALLRSYIVVILALLFVFGMAAFLMRVVDLISDRIMARMDPRERALVHSVLPLGVRVVKICIFGLALLVLLDQWGLHINTILAGVGVGGLAVALAAQKTIENLFGGIAVISDRPVLVGDVCQFGGQTGTVEDIGLRSTRIRTPERTLVTIPNAVFSTMTLENLSRREKILFRTTLQVRRSTEGAALRAFMTAIEDMLRGDERVDATDVPVRFIRIAPEGFVLDVFSYVLTTQSVQFLKVQSELLIRILEIADEHGVKLAVPFAEALAVSS